MRLEERIYLSPPHMSGREMNYIQDAFESNWIAPHGPHIEAFEMELASYVGAEAGAALSSGTAALHLALRLLNVGKGDIVFCSTLTFVASANPILYLGAEPVFIDSEPDTWNMSPAALRNAFIDAANNGRMPKAVVIVHLYGQTAKMNELLELCNEYDVPVIEDAAESLGSSYYGRASGTLGQFGVYSFNGNKIITTSGGGMLVSDDANAIRKARFLASQARDPALHYQHSSLGYNYRMSNILAGVGRAQLEVLDERVQARRMIFKRYHEALSHLSCFQFMPELTKTLSNRWLTALTIESNGQGLKRDTLLAALAAENIEARPVWKPLHLQPLFAGARFYPHDESEIVSEQLFRKGICLPSGSSMTEGEQARVIACVLAWESGLTAKAEGYTVN